MIVLIFFIIYIKAIINSSGGARENTRVILNKKRVYYL